MYIWAIKSFNLRPLDRFSIPYDTDRFHGSISNTCFQLTLYFCAPGKFCRFLYGTHETACGKCSSTNLITLRSTYLPQPIRLSWTNATILSWGEGGTIRCYKSGLGTLRVFSFKGSTVGAVGRVGEWEHSGRTRNLTV